MSIIHSDSKVLSTDDEINKIGTVLLTYLRLPFSINSIPGSIVEHVLGYVREAEVLNTYDFVDVIDRSSKIGWQVKSRKVTTPVTWKRAKISNRENLIIESEKSNDGLDELGAAVLGVCNKHVNDSLSLYGLSRIGYVDLILYKNKLQYIECEIPQGKLKELFCPSDFRWEWSKEKAKGKKEQLTALQGFDIKTDKKWWAWHGRGENQLHFVGEKHWLSSMKTQTRELALPEASDKIPIEDLLEVLSDI